MHEAMSLQLGDDNIDSADGDYEPTTMMDLDVASSTSSPAPGMAEDNVSTSLASVDIDMPPPTNEQLLLEFLLDVLANPKTIVTPADYKTWRAYIEQSGFRHEDWKTAVCLAAQLITNQMTAVAAAAAGKDYDAAEGMLLLQGVQCGMAEVKTAWKDVSIDSPQSCKWRGLCHFLGARSTTIASTG